MLEKRLSEKGNLFASGLLSTLGTDGRFGVFKSFFADGNPTDPDSPFDYKIMVVARVTWASDASLHRIRMASELSFLEALFLGEIISTVRIWHCIVLGARFGPRVARGPRGKSLSAFEVVTKQDESFTAQLLNNFDLFSPKNPLFQGVSLLQSRSELPRVIRGLGWWLAQGAPEPKFVDGLSFCLDWIIRIMRVGTVLTIPELLPREKRKELPLTKEEANRIQLMEDILVPPWGLIRGARGPKKPLGEEWAKIPAYYFVYGPFLDLVNTFRRKNMIKVCWGCGKLYRPAKGEEKKQKHCSPGCANRARSRRDYRTRVMRKKSK